MSFKIKVGLVEDHAIFRQGMKALLEEESSIQVVFEACDGTEALLKLNKQKVDILLMDISMPVVDGKIALRAVSERFPEVSVIMLTAHSDKVEIIECLSLGAKGFLPKHCDFEKLIDALFAVKETGFYYDALITREMVEEVKKSKKYISGSILLSEREIEIVRMVCNGTKNKEIASKLFLSVRTIEGHRMRITAKTGTENLAELIMFARKHGIVND